MAKKLSKEAYGGVAGKDYVPYISDRRNTTCGGVSILIIGIILAALFAASTAYSGMKAGLTVAAGIPGAIVGAGCVKAFAKKRGVLGTSLIQGMASGGESVASGIIFVLPAIVLMGSKLNFIESILIGFAGVLFGVAIASLVFNYLIVEEHGKLMYPESMAISETLVATETGGDALKSMGIGFVIGGLLNFVTGSFMGWMNNTISYVGDKAYKWRFSMEVNPLLLGIGFIVGLEVALTMFAGSILANFAVNPLIGYFADMAKDGIQTWNTIGASDPDSIHYINQLTPGFIGNDFSKYIGAGMMIYGGLVGAIKLVPTIFRAIKEVVSAKTDGGERNTFQMIILVVGVVLAFVAGFMISGGNVTMAILSTIVCLILMVMFVIVAGQLTGTIGTSNLPVSGMTIASLVILTLIFVVMGWNTEADNKSVLLFGTLIVTAIAMSGGYLQSQKVVYIMGSNKNEMQKYFSIAGIIGVVVVVGVISVLASSGQLTAVDPVTKGAVFGLPQANLMTTLTGGILLNNLPWPMIIAGIVLGFVIHLLKLPIMTVAIGFYLSISTTSIILVGALIRVLVEIVVKDQKEKEARVSNGISLSAGLVAGGSILGLIGIAVQVGLGYQVPELSGFMAGNGAAWLLLIILVLLVTLIILKGKISKTNEQE
ncbi:MAG: oligopeptide transporter, OPT family [Bacilli bacterium]|jgi:putative OPT family oligopeptide transporter|nr:oligopeptide transporter, OPT family [Bacilli bacterium]